jgi:hypothetical protein
MRTQAEEEEASRAAKERLLKADADKKARAAAGAAAAAAGGGSNDIHPGAVAPHPAAVSAAALVSDGAFGFEAAGVLPGRGLGVFPPAHGLC